MAPTSSIVAIDTDVLIYIMKRDIVGELLDRYDIAITFITLYEYLRGLARIKRDKNVLREIKENMEELFFIVWPTNRTIMLMSNIWAELSSRGILIDDRDLFIGVMCIENDIPLATFNKKHFKRLEEFGLKLVDLT